MKIRIRPARGEDSRFLAWAMLAASRSHRERGVWDLVFQGPDDEILDWLEPLAVSNTFSFCHHAAFLVAEVDDEPAAALCGYEPEEAGFARVVDAMREVAAPRGWGEAEIAAASQRALPFLLCAAEEPPGTWVIENVATRPEFRRRGLVRRLLEEILERGGRRGYRKAQVAVLIDNLPARRAYEQAGFAFLDEKRHPDFEAAIGSPGIARLGRTL